MPCPQNRPAKATVTESLPSWELGASERLGSWCAGRRGSPAGIPLNLRPQARPEQTADVEKDAEPRPFLRRVRPAKCGPDTTPASARVKKGNLRRAGLGSSAAQSLSRQGVAPGAPNAPARPAACIASQTPPHPLAWRLKTMRSAGWLVALLLALAWWASEVPVRAPLPRHVPDTTWRRTKEGWEHARWLNAEIPPHWPPLHPGIVGALELLLGITALVAFPANRAAPARKGTPRGTIEGGEYSDPPQARPGRGPRHASDLAHAAGLHG